VSEPRVIPAGGGEVIGDAPHRRVEILAETDPLHSTWSRFGPRSEGADLHVHRHHTDLFYVLEGELIARLGPDGEAVAAGAGTLVRVPPLVVHGYRNASDAEVRFLNLHAPGQAFAPYLRALRDGGPHTFDQEPPPDDGGRPATEASVAAGALAVDRPGLHVTLLAGADQIGIAEVATDTRSAPSRPHVHRGHAQSLYVLEGEIGLAIAGGDVTLGTGSWVTVPAGVAHAVAPRGPARFLSVHTPGVGLEPFLRALADADGDADVAAAETGFDRQPAE
jgi:quercetin dioxygenase-like cupin family protein